MTYGNRLLNWINLTIVLGLLLVSFNFNYQTTHHFNGPFYQNCIPYAWVLFFGWQIFRATRATVYFELRDGRFNIRNYLRPWMDTEYALSDIAGIQIRKLALGSGCVLYIMPKGGEELVYTSGVLRASDWQSLIHDFKKLGFDVTYVDGVD
jgi:hypothetical protein